MSPEKRSIVMSRIKGKNTGPENIIMNALSERNIDYESHAKDLPGRPDIVYRTEKVAIFIDGDFWHGWRFPLWEGKLSSKWKEKIAATRHRDQRNFRNLRRMGWKVIRIWEHQIENNPETCIGKIIAIFESRRDARGEAI